MSYKEQLNIMTDSELLDVYQNTYYPESIFEEMIIRLFKEKIKMNKREPSGEVFVDAVK